MTCTWEWLSTIRFNYFCGLIHSHLRKYCKVSVNWFLHFIYHTTFFLIPFVKPSTFPLQRCFIKITSCWLKLMSPSTLNEAGWESAILTCSGWLAGRARYSWRAALRTLWTSSLSLHTSGRVWSERCLMSSRHHNPAAARQEAQAWGNEQHRYTIQIRVCENHHLL